MCPSPSPCRISPARTAPAPLRQPRRCLLPGKRAWCWASRPTNRGGTWRSPASRANLCWLERSKTIFQGDISTLPLVEPPQVRGHVACSITAITLDAQNRYAVEYQAQGFSEQLPGTHIHFFFNTFSADQVGSTGGGNRLMYGGPSPFTGYTPADRPEGAAQLCALVALPDHSVLPDSGNCVDLP